MFGLYNYFMGTKPAVESTLSSPTLATETVAPVIDTPKEVTESGAFKPVQMAQEDMANKLTELKKIQNDFFAIQDRIRSKLNVEIKNSVRTIATTTTSPSSTLAARLDPEKIIEMAIVQAKKDIEDDMVSLKSEAKSHEDYLKQCEAGIAITHKLNNMIHKIHVAMSEPLQNLPLLREKIETSLSAVVSIVPDRPVLQGLLKAVKIANILLKKSQGITDEKLYLEIDKGIAQTTQFLNQDFFELHNVRDALQQKYVLGEQALLSPSRNQFTQFGVKTERAVAEVGTQTELARKGSCHF